MGIFRRHWMKRLPTIWREKINSVKNASKGRKMEATYKLKFYVTDNMRVFLDNSAEK